MSLTSRQKVDLFFWILAGIGILARVWTWSGFDREHLCVADFPAFYAGAKLVGTTDLYSAEAAIAVQQRELGCASPNGAFIRPPFFALMVWPFAQLPIRPAFFAWGAASLVALIAFLRTWDAPKSTAVCFCSWCLPLAGSFTAGQDVAFLLLWLAVATCLMRTDRQFAAGMIMSLCAAKFHLFIMLPLLIVGKRLWRMGVGLATGGAILLGLSFAAGGPRWPIAYWESLRDARIEPHPWEMVNLRAAVHGIPGAALWEVALAISAALACWLVVRRSEFPLAVSAVVAAGLLVSRHSYAPDASLLLLPALTVPFLPQSSLAKVLAVAPMIPPTWFLGAVPGLHSLPKLIPLFLLCALAMERADPRSDLRVENRTPSGD